MNKPVTGREIVTDFICSILCFQKGQRYPAEVFLLSYSNKGEPMALPLGIV
jgi:hypothetical protein